MSTPVQPKQDAHQVIELAQNPHAVLSKKYELHIMYHCGPYSTLWQWSRVAKNFQQLASDEQLWKLFCTIHPATNYQKKFKELEGFCFKIEKLPASRGMLLYKTDHYLVFSLENSKIALMNSEETLQITTLEANPKKIIMIASSANYFAISFSDGLVEVWNVESWEKNCSFSLPGEHDLQKEAFSIEIVGDQLFLVTRMQYYVWQIKNQSLHEIPTKSQTTTNLLKLFTNRTTAQIKYEENSLIVGDSKGTVSLWKVEETGMNMFYDAKSPILNLYFDSKTRILAVSIVDNVHFVPMDHPTAVYSVNLPNKCVSSITWNKSSAFIGTDQGELFKVDLPDHKTRLLHRFEQSIAVQVWKNATQLYVTLENEDVYLLDFES